MSVKTCRYEKCNKEFSGYNKYCCQEHRLLQGNLVARIMRKKKTTPIVECRHEKCKNIFEAIGAKKYCSSKCRSATVKKKAREKPKDVKPVTKRRWLDPENIY